MLQLRESCAAWPRLLAAPFVASDDGEDRVRAKTLLVAMAVISVPIQAVIMSTYREGNHVYLAAIVTAVASTLATLAGWIAWPRARMEYLFLAGQTAAILVGDFQALAKGDRGWSLMVLCVDLALLIDVPDAVTAAMLSATVVYLIAAGVDRMVVGLFDEVGEGTPWICDCSDPPCRQPVSPAINNIFIASFVFLCDFYLTRQFAKRMRHQMAVVQHTIEVTESIAQQLSRYEVEEGRALLEGHHGSLLPDVLRDALHRLLSNLDDYRPYLPDGMLVCEEDADTLVEPPGMNHAEPTVAVCFTDVQSSTELWEYSPQGMYTALQLHSAALRRVASQCGGYEVKVIGDAFMLAFATAEGSCRFALEAQAALADERWPSDLLQHPLCTPVMADCGQLLWSGPRVRIGVHCGTVRVEKNPVTGRCDYFGPTVNIAARVESSTAHGGLIGVTRAVLDALPADAMERLGSPVSVGLGLRELKGVHAPVELTVLLGQRFVGRQAVLTVPGPAVSRLSSRPPSAISSRHSRSSDESSLAGIQNTQSVYTGLWRRNHTVQSTDVHPRKRIDSSDTVPHRVGIRDSVETSPRRIHAVASVDVPPRRAAPPRPIRERLLRRTATCACFRAEADNLASLGHSVELMLEIVEVAADVSQGIVAVAASVQCVVVWNGPRACTDHYSQGLRATDYVRRLRTGIAAGACSGDVLYGNVSAGRKKHAAVIGGCVELASSLAEAAEAAGEEVLAATTFGMYCATQRRAARFSEWRVAGGGTLAVLTLGPPEEGEERWGGLDRVANTQEADAGLDLAAVLDEEASVAQEPARVVLLMAGVRPDGTEGARAVSPIAW